MSEQSNVKELSSDFMDEVSTMLEKLKEKIGKCEGRTSNPSLNFDSCEDFPPKNEAEVLSLINKLQNTLDNITKPDDSSISLLGDDNSSLKNTDSKIDSSESISETPTVLSEDYEANSEDSTDENDRKPIKIRSFVKEICLSNKHGLGVQKDQMSFSSSGSNGSTVEFKQSNQIGYNSNVRRHSKEDARSMLSLAIVKCKSREEIVEKNLNSSDGQFPPLCDSESDTEEATSSINKKKRELPWKIRAAKKRLEHMNKNGHSNNEMNNKPFNVSKSTGAIHFTSNYRPVSQTLYTHSKSAGNIVNVLNQPLLSSSVIRSMSKEDARTLTELYVNQIGEDNYITGSYNLPANSDDSDSCDDEGDVFSVKPITANFLSQQEQQENKEKSRLPFDVRTNDVMKITERFSKPVNDLEVRPLDKAPRKKVYGPVKNDAKSNKEAKISMKQKCKLSKASPIISPKSDVPVIRKFSNKDMSMFVSNPDKNSKEILHTTKMPVSTETVIDSNVLGNSKSYETQLNRKKPSSDHLVYSLSKSKSSPVCFKSPANSGKLKWQIVEDVSQPQKTSLKPCFTSKNEKIKTNMVSDIQSKFKELQPQSPQPMQSISKERPISKVEAQRIDWHQNQDISDDPSVLLFTPEQLLKISIHKAAINKQLSVDPDDMKFVLASSSLDCESFPEKHSVLHHTLSLDSHNISNRMTIPEILSLSGQHDRDIASDKLISAIQKDDNVGINDLSEDSPIYKANIKTPYEEIKRRCFSDSSEVNEDNIFSSKNTKPFVINKANNSENVAIPLHRNVNIIPKSYIKPTERDPPESIVSLSSSISNKKNITSLVNGTILEISDKSNTDTNLNDNMDIAKVSQINDIKYHSKPMLKRQKRQNSLGDAAQLLYSTVSHRKNKEDEVKKRSYSSSIDAFSSMNNGVHNLDASKFNYPNIPQGQVEQTIAGPIGVTATETSANISFGVEPKLMELSQRINNSGRGRSKSLFTLSNENDDEVSNHNVSKMKIDGIMRQYSDQGNITPKAKLGNWKTIDNSNYNGNQTLNNYNKMSFNLPNIQSFQKQNFEIATISSKNGSFPSAAPMVSSSVLSSPEIGDQKKRKPKYTDFVVPPLPTSAHKISQLESRSNPLSPTPSVTGTGAFSDKNLRDSQESDKLNKVSDTWISAAKNPNVITSSKPWTKENNTTIKGQFVKKNKDKLLQTNDHSLQSLTDSNNINDIIQKPVKDYKNNEKENKSDELLKNTTKLKLDLKCKTSRVKDISTKFKMIYDSGINPLKLRDNESTNRKVETTQLKNRLHKNQENDLQSPTDCTKLIKPKSIKIEKKNFIAKICHDIVNDSKKSSILNSISLSTTNKNQHTQPIPTPSQISKNEKFSNNTSLLNGDKLKIYETKQKKSNVVDNDIGPTINKLSKTNEAFKNIAKQQHDDRPNSTNSQSAKNIEKRKSGTLKQCSMWENNVPKNSDTKVTSWKISPSSQSVVKKNKNKLQPDNGVVDNKKVERNCSSTEFKSVLSSFEQKPENLNGSKETSIISSPIPINSTGVIRRQRNLFQEPEEKKDPNFPLRLSKSCTFRHSSFEPFINSSPLNHDISVINRPKPKDSHSVKFSQIVENLEFGDPKPSDGIPHSLKQKPAKRNRPKSLYSSPTDKKCSIINQFPWNKEVGKLPVTNNKSESKALNEDSRKKMESYFKTSQPMSSQSYPTKHTNTVSKDKVVYRPKPRIKSNSSSERSSIYDSWEHLVSNTDYNSQLLDELFSETILKDIELSDSSLSRRRFSDFSVDGNESNSEICVGSKLGRSQTISHMVYRENSGNVAPFNHATCSYNKLYDSNMKESSQCRSIKDHDKARKTLLKLANFEKSSTSKPGYHMNAYEGLVSQSSYVGMSLKSSVDNLKQNMESNSSELFPNHNYCSDEEQSDTSENEYSSCDNETSSSDYNDCELSDHFANKKIPQPVHYNDDVISAPVINITDLDSEPKILSPNVCPTQNPFENSSHRLTVNKQSILLDCPNPSTVKHSELVKNYFSYVKQDDIKF